MTKLLQPVVKLAQMVSAGLICVSGTSCDIRLGREGGIGKDRAKRADGAEPRTTCPSHLRNPGVAALEEQRDVQ